MTRVGRGEGELAAICPEHGRTRAVPSGGYIARHCALLCGPLASSSGLESNHCFFCLQPSLAVRGEKAGYEGVGSLEERAACGAPHARGAGSSAGSREHSVIAPDALALHGGVVPHL